MSEDEMVGWHHQLDGHESEQTPGDSEGQGSLACCSPWGCRVGHGLVTERQQVGVYRVALGITPSLMALSDCESTVPSQTI